MNLIFYHMCRQGPNMKINEKKKKKWLSAIEMWGFDLVHMKVVYIF